MSLEENEELRSDRRMRAAQKVETNILLHTPGAFSRSCEIHMPLVHLIGI